MTRQSRRSEKKRRARERREREAALRTMPRLKTAEQIAESRRTGCNYPGPSGPDWVEMAAAQFRRGRHELWRYDP